jgi:hypothetical protein
LRYQPAALARESERDQEQLEAGRRHDQEVHGIDAGCLVAQESLPGCDRARPPFAMYLATVGGDLLARHALVAQDFDTLDCRLAQPMKLRSCKSAKPS